MNTIMGRLRAIGFLEGVSYLALFGTMFLNKYVVEIKEIKYAMGMAHGVLFMLFVAAVLHAGYAYRWPARKIGLALLSSVLPFGPFVADAKLFREEAQVR